jgi:hypothetical protein
MLGKSKAKLCTKEDTPVFSGVDRHWADVEKKNEAWHNLSHRLMSFRETGLTIHSN